MADYVEMFRLGKTYNATGGPLVIVEDFTLNMSQGEYVCLLGHSGCGKSTVLTMVAGLTPISNGRVVIAGREIDGPGPDRGVVFQSPCLMPWMTALENVLLGVNQVYRHGTPAQRHDIAAYYLNLVGLGGSIRKRASDLSQGMQQRVGIARALAIKPRMLLLDEPFGMLNSLARLELQEVLLGILARDKIATMMITHDVDEALFMSDRVVMMTNGPAARVGEIIELPFERPRVRSEVLEHPLYDGYRQQLLTFLEKQAELKHTEAAEAMAASDKGSYAKARPMEQTS